MITENKNYTESILPYLSLPLVGSPFSGVSQGTPKRRLRPPVEGLSEIGDPTRGRDTASVVPKVHSFRSKNHHSLQPLYGNKFSVSGPLQLWFTTYRPLTCFANSLETDFHPQTF